jgi:carboxyl-terminal processing protease
MIHMNLGCSLLRLKFEPSALSPFLGWRGEYCQKTGGTMKHLRYPWKLSIVFIMIGLIACHLLSAYTPPNAVPPDVEPNFRLMAEAWNTIQRIYVDRKAINPKFMTYGAIGGMVDALGDTGHSRFLSPEMLKQERSLTKGEFEGIGAEVRMRNGQLVIVAPIDGSPAQRAGLKAGDIILKVDGKEVTGLPLNQAVDLILGPAGSPVKLTLLDGKSGHSKEVPLIRAHVTFQSVSWRHLPGTTVAHLRVATFNNGVAKDLRKILTTIQEEGMTGIILDLRNNPGGLYQEAVASASQFLKDGNVLFEKDALGKTKPVPVQPGGIATSIPVVVMINGGTSSGAEIVAGALQDANRARLVGEKTFGTGTVLQTFTLSDGSALMLAIEEWLTPSGHTIWHEGISPDVVVPLPPEVIPLIPATEKELTVRELGQSQDVQLLRALDLLSKQSGLSKQWGVG